MTSKGFSIIFALISTLASTQSAFSFDNSAPPIVVKAGTTTRIFGVFDCKNNIAPGASGMADHGKITVREGKIDRCGNKNQPLTELMYTPDPGFRGQDEAKIFRGGEYTLQKMTVK